MEYSFKLISSLEKVFFKQNPNIKEHTRGSMLKNEMYSFQLVGWIHDEEEQRIKCQYSIESEILPYIDVKKVGYVPSELPSIEIDDDADYITKEPGLFPDPLLEIKNAEIELANNQTRSFWIIINPESNVSGTFLIKIKIENSERGISEELRFTIEIIDAELPVLDIYNTGWFHGDCIAEIHNVKMLSDEYFDIIDKYMRVYVKFGHNMILTPIFTPPLDTFVGGERPTNQLVEVSINCGKYEFDFRMLMHWINLCRSNGIEYFEISHIFTQWGAKHTPKIMASVDGEYRKIFGWETDALSNEYVGFLNTFLPQLVKFLKDEDIFEHCFFHVSDEPKKEHEEQYKMAKSILAQYVNEEQMIDALSEFSFYEKGIIKKPIVSNDHISSYLEHGVTDLWTYYCMAQRKAVSNRFMAMPSYRNRILGYQLYYNQIKGFLQWGFNFWFTQGSEKVINPYCDTTAGGAFPSGDAFVVYPIDLNGNVVCSLRLYVFNEGLQDLRALKLLEDMTNRQYVMKYLEDIDGFDEYPRNSEYILELREEINKQIRIRL